jgi:hypothetical protein
VRTPAASFLAFASWLSGDAADSRRLVRPRPDPHESA